MKLRSALLSLLVIGGGVVVAQSLIASAPQPARKEVDQRRTPVEVVTVTPMTTQITINAMGTVVPARQVDLFSEVGGRVMAQFDGLREGAYVAKGTRLVRVGGRDYKYAVDTVKASLAQAQARLEEERNRKAVAERDWELLEQSLGSTDAGTPMVSSPTKDPSDDHEPPVFAAGDMARRVPQIRSTEANLRSVRSQLKQAQLQVGRTKIVAPFDAVVTGKYIETGQLVGPNTPLATLVGTTMFYVKVSVPVNRLALFAIPGTNTTAALGAPVRVIQELGDTVVERTGHVVRLLGELQAEGRMAQLVVSVEDPFELALPPHERKLPLLLGSYVRVEVEGESIENVIELPRAALREDNTVWVVDADQTLVIREVELRWRSQGRVYIGEGLAAGDRVITSRITVPLHHMPVRVVDAPGSDPTSFPPSAPSETVVTTAPRRGA